MNSKPPEWAMAKARAASDGSLSTALLERFAHAIAADKDDIPRHPRIAISNATRAFAADDLGALATINEDIQQLADAAVGYANRRAASARTERDEARKMLAECCILSGADTDGNTAESGWEHLWKGAVDDVRELRADYDEALRDTSDGDRRVAAIVADLRGRAKNLMQSSLTAAHGGKSTNAAEWTAVSRALYLIADDYEKRGAHK